MARKRSLEFSGSEGTRLTINVEMEELQNGTYALQGPHGKEYRLEVSGVPAEYREAAQRLLADEGDELNSSEARALAQGRAVLVTSDKPVAGTHGPIVRFDCHWVSWDE